MKREATLRRQLHTFQTLAEAVGALRPLAAHHFRMARAQLPLAREYRAGVEQAVGGLKLAFPTSPTGVPGLLVVAADLGLCGGYNSRLAEAARTHGERLGARRVHCVGHRVVTLLARAGVVPARVYPAPTGVRGLPGLLLRLVEELLDEYLAGELSTYHVVSARFGGVGTFTPVCTPLLPVRVAPAGDAVPPSPYDSAEHLAVVAVRELLYILLHELLLDALASEHGARLVATESASEWLEERLGTTRRLLGSLRREASTQEVLAIASGARLRSGE
ncbi:F0F1 ATP synthase subunit gamma [Cystobacter fuscus]|uniref:F0F1 ATP synthase subunit gamma n=1 Tax=Cystobacter fuscus TaxID=43 RepID=UPI0037BFF57E